MEHEDDNHTSRSGSTRNVVKEPHKEFERLVDSGKEHGYPDNNTPKIGF